MIDQEKVMVQPNIWDDLSFEEKVWFYQNWKRAKSSQIKFCTKHRPLRAMESRRRGRVVPGSLRAGCFSAGKI